MHIRCPHCNNPVDVVDDNPSTQLTCPSCGSNFSLLGTAETLPPTRLTRQTLGRFELLDQVGVGQFGMVWKARDTELDRIVAIKIPRRGQLTGDEAEQFLREARAAAQLKHPHIVSTHEVGRNDETIYIVSDFVQGANLSEWLSGQRPTIREAAELCVTIAKALHHAHEAGVVHRDLKPSNIMMDLDGQPHVMDFGLAKREAGEITMTRDGQVLGTPAYMSPEQASGQSHAADRRSDIYSLGVIFFELLTGERPFRGDERMLIVHILRTEAPSPRRLNSRIPKDLETICLKCLEKDAAKRYATAQELSDDLTRWLDGKPIHARPIGSVARGWRWCKRQPVVAGLLAAVILSLTLGSVVATVFGVRSVESEASARTSEHKAKENEDKARQIANVEAKARREAEQQLNRAEWLNYSRQIAVAKQCWDVADVAGAWEQLNACRPDFRGWEYGYLHTLFNSNQRTIAAGQPISTVAFSPDGKRIVSFRDNSIHVQDANTGQEIFTLNGQAGPTPDVHSERMRILSASPDGMRIAYGEGNMAKVWDAGTGLEILTLPQDVRLAGFDDEIAVFSPDGKRIVGVSSDNAIHVWDLAGGSDMATFKGHTKPVRIVAFSPDGTRIVSYGENEVVKVWDAATGREIARLKRVTFSSITSLAFAPDGKSIVVGSLQDAVICDASSGQVTQTLKTNEGVKIAMYSPDGTRIAGGSSDHTIQIWDAGSGQTMHILKGHTNHLRSVSFSPDGRRIVSESQDGTTKLWDASTGVETRTFKSQSGYGVEVVFSPDGKRFATSIGDCIITLWDAVSGKETHTLKGHTSVVVSIAFSPDGKWIVSGSQDNTIKVWDASIDQETPTLERHTGEVTLAFSPDCKRIVSGGARGDGTAMVWDLDGRQEVLKFQKDMKRVMSVAFSPDGKRVATSAETRTADRSRHQVKVWDAATGDELLKLDGHTFLVWSVAFSPDGTRIISGSGDKTVKVWDAANGNLIATCQGHTDGVNSVAFSPDGKRIVSGGDDQTVKVWDAATASEILTLNGHAEDVWSVAFSPDGKRIASGSGDRKIKIWDVETGRNTLTLDGHTDMVDSVAFSPDGTRIISGSFDRTIKLWNASNGQETLTLMGHSDSVHSVVFSSDGKRIASGSGDGTIKIWDASLGDVRDLKSNVARTVR